MIRSTRLLIIFHNHIEVKITTGIVGQIIKGDPRSRHITRGVDCDLETLQRWRMS
jgi:hypothetical protein